MHALRKQSYRCSTTRPTRTSKQEVGCSSTTPSSTLWGGGSSWTAACSERKTGRRLSRSHQLHLLRGEQMGDGPRPQQIREFLRTLQGIQQRYRRRHTYRLLGAVALQLQLR